jgi:hypothetical protein
MRPFYRLLPSIRATAFLFLFLSLAGTASAQDLDRAAHDLAARIAAAAGSDGKILLDVHDLSSLGPAEAARARQSLEAELRKAGLHLVKVPPADAVVHVTLAENVLEYLWVAQILRGGTEQVEMIAIPRAPTQAQSPLAPSLVLHKQFVWRQSTPILAFALFPPAADGLPRLFVLEPERVALYRFDQSRWQLQEDAPIQHVRPWPRDLRGRMNPAGDALQVSLPGVSCSAVTRLAFVLQCAEDPKSEWRFSETGESATFSSARNFFSATAATSGSPQTALPPFFSAAFLKSPGSTRTILSGLDGQALLYEDLPQPIATFTGWGSDIAAITSGCGAAWQVLATRPGDWTQPDAIQAFEIIERQTVAVTQPLDFDGPVMDLWPASGGKSANVVVRNLKTGQYEAYSLSLSCGR